MRKIRIIASIVLFLFLFVLTGCGTPNPEDSVKKMFESMKKADFKTAAQYLKNDKDVIKSENPAQEKALVDMVSRLDYEIVSSSVNGDKATVKTKVTAPNMPVIVGKIMGELLPQLFASAFSGMDEKVSEDMFNDTLEKKLAEKDVPMTTTEVDLNLVLENDKWLVVGDDNVANAITGNLVKAFEDVNQDGSGGNSDVKPDPKVYKVEEEAVLGRAGFTVMKVERSRGKDYVEPGEGNEFIIVTVKKVNKSQDTLSYSESDFSIQTSNGQILDPTYDSFGKEFGSGNLAANGSVEGNVVFEAPKGDNGLLFMYTPDFDKKAFLKFDIGQ